MSIPLIDKAFLPEYKALINGIEMSSMAIAAIIQVIIGVLAFSKLHRSQQHSPGRKIRREIVFLFCVSFMSALLYTIGNAVTIKLHMLHGRHDAVIVGWSINAFFYGIFFLNLLITLVTRLYVTFDNTDLSISKHTKYLFIVIFMLLFIFTLSVVTGFTLRRFHIEFGWTLYLSTYLVGILLYVVGCVLAVRLFVVNLSIIAKLQANTLRGSPRANPEDISLNETQCQLLRLSAKYVLLFFIALLASFLTIFFIFIVSSECAGLFVSADICVNMLCLYLQFAFASKHYQICCGCLDSRCRAVEVKRMKRIMHSEALSLHKQVIAMSNTMSNTSEKNSKDSVQTETIGTEESVHIEYRD